MLCQFLERAMERANLWVFLMKLWKDINLKNKHKIDYMDLKSIKKIIICNLGRRKLE